MYNVGQWVMLRVQITRKTECISMKPSYKCSLPGGGEIDVPEDKVAGITADIPNDKE